MQTLSEIVNQIQEATKIAEATRNKPEAKLRELTSSIWERFLKEKRVGLNLQIREELILANGRPDTVFNKLILEYKKPNTIKPSNDKNRKLISQVQGYILDLAKKERFSKQRLLGVAFDGNYFLFMRYVKRWIEEQPVAVNEDSLELFLKNLEKLTSKAALIPENLIRDFAVGKESRNKVAVDCIKAFYNEINQHGSEGDTKLHWFFQQWKIQFAEVHGSLEQKKIDRETLFTSYGFSKKEQKDFNVLAFFFALDSYFALLMKLLSYQVVGFYTLKDLVGLPLHAWEKLSSDDLGQKCEKLEEGTGIFQDLNIRNFLEGDLFSWYTEAWNDEIYKAIKQIIKHLNDYDPETMEVAPDETRDILKKLYQYLVPKQIRHDLGEYYTPDWLAERCLNQLNYNGDPKYRILDPGCGSGTFPVLAIKRAKEFARNHNIEPAETLKNILRNIYGFDLNPLAVICARTNYMMAIADLLKYSEGEIIIPIYLCDSINPPQARVAHEMTLFPEKIPYEVKTTVGNFLFSHSIVTKRRVQALASITEDCVKAGKSKEDFLRKVKTKLNLTREEFEESELYMEDTYEKLVKLKRRGINGIWARIIKNAFAPLFVGQFDMVVGNPPWVNWESLPEEYRTVLLPINHNTYKLFLHKGLAARHGSAKIDMCSLMLYVSADRYLKDDGSLCFVVTQTLFKTAGGSKGFRQFYLHTTETPLKVVQVDDMVELQPFEGAANRTALVFIRKGQKTKYPCPYLLWRKSQIGRIDMDLTYKEVFSRTKRFQLYAKPVDDSDECSSWITGRRKALEALSKVVGASGYIAHEGSNTGGANGVYWIKIDELNGNYLTVSNLFDIGKRKVNAVTMEIESDLVYPLIRGRDLKRWNATSSTHIIVPQRVENPKLAYDNTRMQKDFPKTYKYLLKFRDALDQRKSAVIRELADEQGFYLLYGVKEYTLTPYKVVWKEQAQEFQCAVVSKSKVGDVEKVLIPDHKLMLVPFENKSEAHFVAACLNSCVSRFVVMAYVISIQQGTHILSNIAIPDFDASNPIHGNLSRFSRQCHEKAAKGIDVTDLEEQIDQLAAEMWGLTSQELKDIKDGLEELR
ncbi:MAG: N-6 DNA methylase [candidate division Zixibacteria bacterium]|nr:N-6 DNA methylase [candidate division Zixibacteria bacterium]